MNLKLKKTLKLSISLLTILLLNYVPAKSNMFKTVDESFDAGCKYTGEDTDYCGMGQTAVLRCMNNTSTDNCEY